MQEIIDFFEKNKSSIAKTIVLLFVIMSAGFLIVFIFTGMNLFHHHESAYTLLYGDNVLKHGLYSPTFSGRETAYITWAPIAALCIKLFGFNLFAHSMSSFIYVLFTIFVILYFTKKAHFSILATMLLIGINLVTFDSQPISYRWFDQVWVWPMNSYGIYDLFSVILMLIVANTFTEQNNKLNLKYAIAIFLLIVAVFIFSLNSIRGAIVIIFPVLSAIILYTIRFNKQEPQYLNQRSIAIFIFIFVMLVGMYYHKLLTIGTINEIQASHTLFSKPDIIFKFTDFFQKWFSLFGGTPIENLPIFSIEGASILIKFALASIFLIAPFYFYQTAINISRLSYLFFIKHCAIFAVVLFAYVFGSSHQERYLIPLAISSFFITIILIDFFIKKSKYKLLYFILLSSLTITLSNIFSNYNNVYSYLNNKDMYLSKNYAYNLSKFLLEHNLTKGYETRWYRQTLPVNLYSSGVVKLGLLEEDFSTHFHADKDWFNPVDENIFLLVDKYDFNENPYILYLKMNYSYELLEYNDRYILVFKNFPYKIIDMKNYNLCHVDGYLNEKNISSPLLHNGEGISCKNWFSLRSNNGHIGRVAGAEAGFFLKFDKAMKKEIKLTISTSDSNKTSFSIYRGGRNIFTATADMNPKDFIFDDLTASDEVNEYVIYPNNANNTNLIIFNVSTR